MRRSEDSVLRKQQQFKLIHELFKFFAIVAIVFLFDSSAQALTKSHAAMMVTLNQPLSHDAFPLAVNGRVAPIYAAEGDSETVRVAARAFADDVAKVTGTKPEMVQDDTAVRQPFVVIVGTIGNSPLLDQLRREGKIRTSGIEGRWESAVTAVVDRPFAGVKKALVIAGSDRRGAAFALFTISRQMGVSPWTWWADVPVRTFRSVGVRAGTYVQGEPSVKYRGIFFNDEDWGLRPWAARKMDPKLDNIGPHTYEHVFELLLRLHANMFWPAMHPGTLPFNAVPENARLAQKWGIVMGSSHSEALLRNNVGEWDRKKDGPWNYQTNSHAIDEYWKQRLKTNSKYENFYTVGMRGQHDSGLEATGSAEVKARLVEQVMKDQRQMLRQYVNEDLDRVPQVIWLYKESIDLYRAGMKVPDDVTLGWTDDNYGYIRQLPNAEERKRSGGSGIYYHVSYWGRPHDYLWLCTTPPALMREELSKAWDHGVRRLWVLNVGDLKPAESDIDYFLQLAWNEPEMARVSQKDFLRQWAAEQFPSTLGLRIATLWDEAYRLNFVRKPELMGFNGYDDDVKRTEFNPLAWGDQNRTRLEQWNRLNEEAESLKRAMPENYRNAFFELVYYPVEAAAEQNAKFLWADRSYLDAGQDKKNAVGQDAVKARAAYDRIQALTRTYNSLDGGKWDGMMSAHPRERHVFDMPATAGADMAKAPLPKAWWKGGGALRCDGAKGIREWNKTVSVNATHFTRKQDGNGATWRVLPELGVDGGSMVLGRPGLMKSAGWVGAAQKASTEAIKKGAWLEYDFNVSSTGEASLEIDLLPTFPVDSNHGLHYAVALDGGKAQVLDASGAEGVGKDISAWTDNVRRNAAAQQVELGSLRAGHHRLRLIYGDPGVIFEHLTVSFAGASPAYPVPPETVCGVRREGGEQRR